MKHLATGILVLAGLINLYPIIGVISAAQLEKLYGLPLEHPDLVLLMRHRAVLFGLLGALIIASAFRTSLRPLAITAGLISMLAFIVLALVADHYGAAIHKIVVADVLASVGLVAVLLIDRTRKND